MGGGGWLTDRCRLRRLWREVECSALTSGCRLKADEEARLRSFCAASCVSFSPSSLTATWVDSLIGWFLEGEPESGG